MRSERQMGTPGYRSVNIRLPETKIKEAILACLAPSYLISAPIST